MECSNHPGVEAVNRCSGCSEPFCNDCIVEIKGEKYCSNCKVMALEGHQVQLPMESLIPCKEASDALKLAIFSLFCFGFIIGPIAIFRGFKARRIIDENPNLTGGGKATAAIVIGIIVVILNIIGIMAKVSEF